MTSITAQRGQDQALSFAAKGGDALSNLLYNIAKRKEEEGKGPIETVLFLEEHYSNEEGHMIPEIGSKQGETGNKPYDRYTIKNKENKSVQGSWFTDVVKSTQAWRDLNTRREFCKVGEGEGCPQDIIAMGPIVRAEEVTRISNFIVNMRTALTRGAALLHQLDRVNSMNPKRVKASMPVRTQLNDKGEEYFHVYGNLIRIVDPSGETQEGEVKTVSQFLQWDVAAAVKTDGGTIASLKLTSARAPKKGSGKDGAGKGKQYTVPSTLSDIKLLLNVLASGLDNGTEEGRKMEAQLLSACAKDGPEGEEAVISTGDVALAMDNIWTVISNRYNAIKARRAAALNTKTAATV